MNMITTMGLPPIAPPDPASMRRALLGASNLAAADRHLKLRRLFAAFDRNDMEAGVELLLSALDAMDGDPDVEANGDEADSAWLDRHGMGFTSAQRRASSHEDAEEDDAPESDGDDLDTNNAEDERPTVSAFGHAGPGCTISDPDCGTDDGSAPDAGDRSWTEWHTRGRQKLGPAGSEARTFGTEPNEDTEDDDADQGIEDDPRGCDPEEDMGHDGREPEEDEPDEGYTVRRPHRDRIRRIACDRTPRGPTPYRLRVRNAGNVPGFGSALV